MGAKLFMVLKVVKFGYFIGLDVKVIWMSYRGYLNSVLMGISSDMEAKLFLTSYRGYLNFVLIGIH